MKKTKIICSIGPSSCKADVLVEMINSGMNVARINFSHATDEEKLLFVSEIKKAREMSKQNIAIL